MPALARTLRRSVRALPAPSALVASLVLAMSTITARAGAQGTISGQGYGYPPGQLSTQALSTGGALAEFDPLSPINPAALTQWLRGGIFVQYDPEFRRVSLDGRTDRTTTARFPLIAAAVNFRDRGFLGISTSTLLDRTWATTFRSGQRIGTDSVTFTEEFRSNGAINDIRLGLGWTLSTRIALGIGLHVFTGENRLDVARVFPDSTQIGSLNEEKTLSFTGTGVSAGVMWRPARHVGVGVSGRLGGDLDVRSADTVLREAKIPARAGAAIRFDGLTGAAIAARADYVRWTDIAALGTADLSPRDGWDIGIGADVAGPRFGGTQIGIRAGFRRRTLPFDVAGSEARETAVTGGLGIPLGGGRAALDIGVQRAVREAGVDAEESAWILSFGVTVRP